MLLGFERGHRRWKLSGRNHIFQIHKSPPLHLGAIRQIQVFGNGVVLPTTSIFDGRSAPHARRTVEVEPPATAVPSRVFDHEVPI